MLNKREGNAERGFYFHGSPFADLCRHNMVTVEGLFLTLDKALNITEVGPAMATNHPQLIRFVLRSH